VDLRFTGEAVAVPESNLLAQNTEPVVHTSASAPLHAAPPATKHAHVAAKQKHSR
jgi:hypothetical protein